jgi:hypothetical protein
LQHAEVHSRRRVTSGTHAAPSMNARTKRTSKK